MATPHNPFSLIAQLTREIRPSRLEERKILERQQDRARRQTEEHKAKNRERMKKVRAKNG